MYEVFLSKQGLEKCKSVIVAVVVVVVVEW